MLIDNCCCNKCRALVIRSTFRKLRGPGAAKRTKKTSDIAEASACFDREMNDNAVYPC